MGPVVLGGVRHLDSAGGKSDFSRSATAAECFTASRSRWTVLMWWESPSGTHPSPCLLQSSTQPSVAQACAQRPYQQATARGCRSLSTERQSQPLALLKPLSFYWTQPHPCTVPLHNPTHSGVYFDSQVLPFLNQLRWQKEGSWSHEQQLLCGWPSAVLQFLLLKHWFQMVLDTKMEKSKPPCETSFQKKRISLKKEGRCDRKTQPLPRAEVSSCSSTCDGTWYMDPLERHREELQSDAQRTWKSKLIIYTDNRNTKLMNSVI